MEVLCMAGITGFVMAFPKAVLEVTTPFVPKFISESLQESKVNSCLKKPEPICEDDEEATETEEVPPRASETEEVPVIPLKRAMTFRIKKNIQSNENYINIDWKEYDVPEKAMKCIDENIGNVEEYEKITNTCVKLLEFFAMKSHRKADIYRIRDIIMQHDSELAEKIDMDKFSQCAFYEGRILLYR